MANSANINPTPEQKAVRTVARIPRLRQALAKEGISEERKASLQAELDRRIAEVSELKAALEAV